MLQMFCLWSKVFPVETFSLLGCVLLILWYWWLWWYWAWCCQHGGCGGGTGPDVVNMVVAVVVLGLMLSTWGLQWWQWALCCQHGGCGGGTGPNVVNMVVAVVVLSLMSTWWLRWWYWSWFCQDIRLWWFALNDGSDVDVYVNTKRMLAVCFSSWTVMFRFFINIFNNPVINVLQEFYSRFIK